MRRFINSKLGKVVGNAVAMALIVPYVTLAMATKAVAQQVSLPSWAVLDFRNLTDRGPATLGADAADAVRTELEKTQAYDPIARETIDRALKDLDLQMPVVQKASLLRLGTELNATSVVTGDVVNWRVVRDGSGKRAEVIMRLDVLDVASGQVVNGAALATTSTVRPLETADDTLLLDAIKTAAFTAVKQIVGTELPKAAVLSTAADNTALINSGGRSGFKLGQQVIILRGKQQVGTGHISDVDPDQSTVTIDTWRRGVQPGDKVRAIFTQPDISTKFGPGTTVIVNKPKHTSGGNSGLLTALAIVGLLVAVISGGSSGQEVLARVRAEATDQGPSGLAAVQITWTPDFITKGSDRRIEWDVWRNDITFGQTQPVRALPGSQLTVMDTSALTAAGAITYTTSPTISSPGGTTCAVTSPTTATNATAFNGVTSGVPYFYSVSLIYRLMGIELPVADTTDPWCYFSSSQTAAVGSATPYDAPTLLTPNQTDTVSGPVTFTWNASGSAIAPLNVIEEYVLEISSSPVFPKGNQTITLAKFQNHFLTGATQTAGPFDLSGIFPTATSFYWRVGVKNIGDVPGPVPDPRTGERYVFSGGSIVHRL